MWWKALSLSSFRRHCVTRCSWCDAVEGSFFLFFSTALCDAVEGSFLVFFSIASLDENPVCFLMILNICISGLDGETAARAVTCPSMVHDGSLTEANNVNGQQTMTCGIDELVSERQRQDLGASSLIKRIHLVNVAARRWQLCLQCVIRLLVIVGLVLVRLLLQV